MDGGVPGGLGGGRGARADVVDGADVAAVEADARAGAEHGFVGGVGGGQGEGWRGERWRRRKLEGEGGERGIVAEGGGKRGAGDGAGKGVVHRCEAIFGAEADALPDAIFGRDQVGEVFADKGEAGKGGDVGDGEAVKDMD